METRLAKADYLATGNRLSGYAILWNSPAQVTEGKRSFWERVAPGAVNLASDVVCCFNHDVNRLLGRLSSGTLQIEQDARGVRFSVDLPESAQDVRELVARGDVKGCSFTFGVRAGGETWDGDTRTLTSIDVVELGPVTMPAYPQTSVSLRNNLSVYKAKLRLLEIQSRKHI